MSLLLPNLCKDSFLYAPLVEQRVERSKLFEVLPIVTASSRWEDHIEPTSPLEFSLSFPQDHFFLLGDLLAIDTTWNILFDAKSGSNAAQVLFSSRRNLGLCALVPGDVWLHDIDLVDGVDRTSCGA